MIRCRPYLDAHLILTRCVYTNHLHVALTLSLLYSHFGLSTTHCTFPHTKSYAGAYIYTLQSTCSFAFTSYVKTCYTLRINCTLTRLPSHSHFRVSSAFTLIWKNVHIVACMYICIFRSYMNINHHSIIYFAIRITFLPTTS